MGDTMEKRARMKERGDYSGGGGSKNKLKNIFHSFKSGSNVVRLVGNFLDVRTHYIAPNVQRKDKGICVGSAFEKKEIPHLINCPNWDVEKEEDRDGNCPICKIFHLARKLELGATSEEEKKKYKNILEKTRPRRALKWNIIDRDDPWGIEVDEVGKEKKVKIVKIATIGIEAWKDIDSIFDQVGVDITDEDSGIDINIKRDDSGQRTKYSAQIVLEKGMVKKTPLTEEEKGLFKHDLTKVCGKQPEIKKIEENLLPEFKAMLGEDIRSASPKSESEMNCFGTYEEGHDECKNCDDRDKCKEIKSSKKKK